jgi:hypothetical protein
MEVLNMLEINLTPEKEEIIKDEIQAYADALATDRLIRKADRERSVKILALSADTDEELSEKVAPLILAEKERLEAIDLKEIDIKEL